MSVGNRLLTRQRRVDPERAAAFAALPVAVISDSMSRVFAGGANLRPIHHGGVLTGLAITRRSRLGDNLIHLKDAGLEGPKRYNNARFVCLSVCL